jgi:3-oxoacid CoA-transferase
VEEIVPNGTLAPQDIHLPGIYVKAIVVANEPKRIEKLTLLGVNPPEKNPKKARAQEAIAKRAALELKDGMCVNLGIGIPTQAANFIPEGMEVKLQSENGLLGMGPFPEAGKEDADLINAGKQTITMLDGASLFSSSDSFAMIRGNHVDVTILGALEVSERGDLANWFVPAGPNRLPVVKGMGGAMDLVSSGSRVVVTMEHTEKDGKPKILKECTYPLTAPRCVSRIITDLGVIDVTPQGLELVEVAEGVSVEAVIAATGAPLIVSPRLIKK